MTVVRRIAQLRAALDDHRAHGRCVGFVPTMGAFHDGHRSLMRRARQTTDVVVVSLFLNPTQFGDPADLAKYPRDEQRDASIAAEEEVDLLFVPDAGEMYPTEFATTVNVGGVSEPLEGASRGASHFAGVATVVAKLLNIVQPTVAFFGQKDAQQALVVKRMARDLDFPVRIELCPTMREPDGLAMSSRNVRLDAASRQQARSLGAALFAAERVVAAGERDSGRVLAVARDVLSRDLITPEYLALVSTDTLEPVAAIQGEALLVLAAVVGGVRLIDNILLTLE